MRPVLVIVIGVFAASASGLLRGTDVPSRPAEPSDPAKPYGLGMPPFAQASSASCASASCHGGGRVGNPGSEHSTWAPVLTDGPHDPHARAYRVLFNADSARMAKSLGVEAAHKHALCLKCHAVDDVRPEPAATEGVGCGACHGPAEKWLAAHVQPGWKSLSNREKWEKHGFVPAGNLVARTLNCVGCHVGDADRDVNHDLIAVGHPRLNFEYTRFHFNPNYRRHWSEKTPQPDFEVRAWVAGQAATLRAATELLRVRADRAAADSPRAVWPEFAGLSCYACHQKIGNAEPNRGDAATKRAVGTAGWDVWSNAAAKVAADLGPLAFPGVASPKLGESAALRTLMEKRSPDPRAVAEQAARAVAELDRWLAELQASEDRHRVQRIPADAPRKFAHALAANALSADHSKLADHDWDALAANYLGCAAMYHASGGRVAEAKWAEPVRGLAADLKFPARFGRLGRDDVRDSFRKLYDATTTGGKR